MNIEFAKVENSKQLAEVVLAATEELRGIDFTEEGWNRFVTSNTLNEFEKKLGSSEFSVFCCIESNCILGFISLKNQEKIDQLFVIPEARNRGVASSLWQVAKKNAIENGALGKFWVRSSSVAIPVYQKFGFMCEGNRQSFGGINFQVMRLEVNS
jgi:GNAT superfamily N-acetyltransferase